MIYSDYLSTPIGIVSIKASDAGLTEVFFIEAPPTSPVVVNIITDQCKQQLNEYFKGDRQVFTLTLNAKGTAFQQSVWQSLVSVGYGESASYSDIAQMIANPKAVRAVGGANGRNPISIIVPCHRVIGRNGTLTGYAGGMERKAWLLQHEAKNSGALLL